MCLVEQQSCSDWLPRRQMILREAGCGRGTVKQLKTVTTINDSRTYLVLSPAATVAVVAGANSPTMAKSLKKANGRINT